MVMHSTDKVHEERIQIDLTADKMKAVIKFNLTEEELSFANRQVLIKETALKLREKGIVYGTKSDIFIGELLGGQEYIIAEGLMPENGVDSKIRLYEIKEVKPEVIESEKCDYYNLSLIPTVEADTWLGEREDATEGKDGCNVLGHSINAQKGTTFPLYYDKEFVYEKYENNKTVIYSKVYGAVYFKGASISLMNPLIIDGDVDFKTGNINFDGHVIIKGTICDGFYVEATNNIEVNGELGLGNIKGINSRSGSIFVKGGLICKGNVTLKAAKNVYVKFIENASIVCGGTAHIGFYCANSTITAKEVIVDSFGGKIFGGSIKVATRVLAPIIGSELGKKTVLEVTGFDREATKAQIEANRNNLHRLKNEYETVRHRIASYSVKPSMTTVQHRILEDAKGRFKEIFDEIKQLNDEKENFAFFYNTRGDGEINISKKVFPNTTIIMKNKTLEITSAMIAATYIFQGGKIIQM